MNLKGCERELMMSSGSFKAGSPLNDEGGIKGISVKEGSQTIEANDFLEDEEGGGSVGGVMAAIAAPNS